MLHHEALLACINPHGMAAHGMARLESTAGIFS
jgi:hypothetical protein